MEEFEDILVNISERDKELILEMAVSKYCEFPTSREVFHERKHTHGYPEALIHAIFNDFVNRSLLDMVERNTNPQLRLDLESIDD